MTAEIICVGTEILLGNIVNTNAAYLAEKCAYLGLSNYYQVVVGDNEQRLLETINTAKSRADVIFLIGGLGPTEDDLTKETAAKAFNVELVMDEEAKNNIVTILTNRGIDITNNNFKQALVPKGSIVLYNKNGTAPGIIMEEAGKVVIMLPGPPNEFVPMVDDQVVPYFLKKGTNDVIYSRVVKLVGVGESKVAEEISDLIAMTNPTVATYAKTGEVHIRVTASAANDDEAKALVKPVVKKLKAMYPDNVYSTNADETLERAVVELLSKNGLSITAAESCTGGLVCGKIVNVAGASEVFRGGYITYSNKQKRNVIGVKKSTLEKYGAVSEQVAAEMAKGVLEVSKADVAISTTGIAGPGGGTPEKPVGLVYIGCAVKNKVYVEKFNFSGSRNKVRESTVVAALSMVRKYVSSEYN
ncbi:MAG: competence/damage-inducible protein A [Lachnospiraceae bacterium]|jgi:nicotinamide-nucleotide amidase|nr:competence/damage-inducible protein A [Lachnospiraceae bacterium]MCI6409943.1 competence/damage-inducible protein A [Lachnospiraceae bacterium]MCI6977779.1 competence/damage-inducible protein A [Lachnospiraceae bacterium]MDD7224077.1 competence/damage-inducible protein A [Lachnospiraceae bacterium]MDY3254905.1 competence/damage-inducible protein A [Lachnospiraceae bacterium]